MSNEFFLNNTDLEHFKLRLEDGSDVKYNSLIFTVGDDLEIPLTYTPQKDDFIDDVYINGESKRIPTNEARYVTYTLKSNINIKNALCKIDIINIDSSEDASNILIGCDNQAELFNSNTSKFCIIKELISNKEQKIKFIVQSDTEQSCIFKLNFLTYDEYESDKWTPCNIIFKDMPNAKLSIKANQDDLTTDSNSIVNISYNIENTTAIQGTNIKFKIVDPASFEIQNIDVSLLPEGATFDEYNSIITFPTFPGREYNELTQQYTSQEYTLTITYKATKKGIYNFILQTYDDKSTLEDDQWVNSVSKKILVNISSNTIIKTSVSNSKPYLNELIDFKIDFKNFLKKQNKAKFIIKDIGHYDIPHDNHYEVQYYTVTNGTFIDDDIGNWLLNDVDINNKEELILTLRPQEIGYHIIQTTFIDNDGYTQEFENTVNVMTPNKQMDFKVYHGVGTSADIECDDFENIIEICDDDYIDIDDTLFFICEIINNNRNDIIDTTHLYIRLDDSFLDNGILCSTHNIEQEENNLLHITIPNIKSCTTTKVCFKIKPSKIGSYISNFMLTNRNARVYHQNLKININKEFQQKQLEHEIKIYNFEKTNHYFRYELDSDNNIFKFFNQGNNRYTDKSLRMVDVEEFNQNSIETYRGTNLRKLVRDIAKNSKYVEPELLHINNNKLAPKQYELYPDGFIRRFGLLNSEVFHYTGQLPTISHLSDKAMRWNIDDWDTKVWGGDIYDNGIFDLTIDYNKIPKNFNILELDNPIRNLQVLVDKVKPFGTQAVCYYSAKLYLDLNIDMDLRSFEINNNLELLLKLSDLELISLYNQHDKSIKAYYDLLKIALKTNADLYTLAEDPSNSINLRPDMSLSTEIYDQQYSKIYISDCYDIVHSLYANNPSVKNIDIVKDFNYEPQHLRSVSQLSVDDIYCFEYEECDITSIYVNEDVYNIKCVQDDFNSFIGFKIYKNDIEKFSTNFYTKINNYNIQIQMCNIDAKNIIHIFCSINNQQYIHTGYFITNSMDIININPHNYQSFSKTTKDTPIKFKIKNTVSTTTKNPNKIVEFNNNIQWQQLKNIHKKNKYAFIENNIDIDQECRQTNVKVPTLGVKFNNINIDNNDEIIDVKFKIKARTNKNNFIKDLTVKPFLNGDSYVPENNIARHIYHPNKVVNINKDYSDSIILQQPNITICANCLHTHLGLYNECPHCGSSQTTQYDNKKAVTVCKNPECQWITDDWYDYCPHCLSENVEKTKVDFNKTYCYDCKTLSNDYYPACPKCFSTNIIHMNNDQKQYKIQDVNTQNIDELIIKTDTNRVNLCNIEVKTNIIKELSSTLEYLYLHLYGTNHNVGEFYYCENCGQAHLGHTTKCSFCQSENVVNKTFNNTIIDIYYKTGDVVKKINTYQIDQVFDIPIDILSLTDKTIQPSFNLLIYVENLLYDEVNNYIDNIYGNNLIDDDSYDLLVDNIPLTNLTLNNIYYNHKYVNEPEWEGLQNLQYINHTGIKYITTNNNKTNCIQFSDFQIENDDQYTQAFLNISGINKTNSNITLKILITDQNGNENKVKIENIQPQLFTEKIDIFKYVDNKLLKDINIQIKFENVDKDSEIIITHLYITTEKNQSKNILHNNLEQYDYNFEQKDDAYLISTYNLFNLRKNNPYYIDGQILDTNLVCYIDFGTLHNQEYIRLYDIEAIILYKNKYGRIITEAIDVSSDEKYTKYMSNAIIQKNNTEIWGSIHSSNNILNNLESQIFNNDDEESLQAIPLKNELLQAFTIKYNNIEQIHLKYDGHIGHPSDIITVEIFDDNQNSPDNLLYSSNFIIPQVKDTITFNIDLDNLIPTQYWIKLTDSSANDYNYHKFNYNNHTEYGKLILNDKHDANRVLSLSIDSSQNIQKYHKTPNTLFIGDIRRFKTSYVFYRYNIQSANNGYVQNIKNSLGYLYIEPEEYNNGT